MQCVFASTNKLSDTIINRYHILECLSGEGGENFSQFNLLIAEMLRNVHLYTTFVHF